MTSEIDFKSIITKYNENKDRATKRFDSNNLTTIKLRNQFKDLKKRMLYLAELMPDFNEPLKYTETLFVIIQSLSNEFQLSKHYIFGLMKLFSDEDNEFDSIQYDTLFPLSDELSDLALKVNWSITKLMTDLTPNEFKTYFSKKLMLTFDEAFEKLKNVDNSIFMLKRCLNIKEVGNKQLKESMDHLNHLPYYYREIKSQLELILAYIDINKSHKFNTLNLLEMLGINSAVSMVKKSNHLFTQENWPETVLNMRIAWEIVVNWLVQQVSSNKNWSGPMVDGLKILKDTKIITEDTFAHLRARSVGIYGYVSLKGAHSDGTTIDNLAKTKHETTYANNLLHNAIEMMLSSFILSEYYKEY